MIILERIISGGQTGADMGGLLAARDLSVPTGGFAPKGFLTEKGPRPDLATYGLVETSSPLYPPRTKLNIRFSEGTVIFSRLPFGRGSRLTFTECVIIGRHKIVLDPHKLELLGSEFVMWLGTNAIRVLNVAGSRESKDPGIEERVRLFLLSSLRDRIWQKPK